MGNIITGAGSSTQFAAALNALRSITKVNTLSTPKILAIHGKQARVQVGGQQGYPVSTTSDGVLTQSVEFIPTGTTLNITPYIDDDGNVLLEVKPEISSVTLSSSGIPTVQTTNVSTWLLAKDGQTVFMGGLIKDTKSKTREMIPCLGSIPGVGALFGRMVQTGSKTELVVLITPHIISTEQDDLDRDVIDKTRAMEQELRKGDKSPNKEFLDFIFPSK
jgi:type II secretory pathway component GspD/PulD (secretin)